MPGEISRSNPGPKGNAPVVPPWIEKMNSEAEMSGHDQLCERAFNLQRVCSCQYRVQQKYVELLDTKLALAREALADITNTLNFPEAWNIATTALAKIDGAK